MVGTDEGFDYWNVGISHIALTVDDLEGTIARIVAAAGRARTEEFLARFLSSIGSFPEAQETFLAAVDRGTADPVRQLARASSCAVILGDKDQADALLREAHQLPGGATHPAVVLRETAAGRGTGRPVAEE